MKICHIELFCSTNPAIHSCRAWIDPDSDAALESEFEVHLRRDHRGWSGTFLLPQDATQFYYRVGLLGAAGSSWNLSVRAARGLELLRDGDCMAQPKTWILGSCDSS